MVIVSNKQYPQHLPLACIVVFGMPCVLIVPIFDYRHTTVINLVVRVVKYDMVPSVEMPVLYKTIVSRVAVFWPQESGMQGGCAPR